MVRRILAAAIATGLMTFGGAPGCAADTIVLASTTSVENSGLLTHILTKFTEQTGITVRVIAQGTGQALATAARGDADLGLVHDPEAEQHFVAEGHGANRRQIAWNDFVVVGPRSDPALCRSFRAATRAGLTLWNTAFGGRPPSTLLRPALAGGTVISAAAWGRRSMPPQRWAPIHCPIAAPGSVSATRASSPCWSREIRGC